MANLYNITDWSEQPWLNKVGTRNKKIYLNQADNELSSPMKLAREPKKILSKMTAIDTQPLKS